MVLSQKTITIPSWSKIDHRYGLSRPADYPYWLQHIQYTLLTKMTTTSAAPSQSKISDLDEKWERSAVSGDVAVAPPAPGGGILTSRPHQLKPTNRHQLKPTDTNWPLQLTTTWDAFIWSHPGHCQLDHHQCQCQWIFKYALFSLREY